MESAVNQLQEEGWREFQLKPSSDPIGLGILLETARNRVSINTWSPAPRASALSTRLFG